MRFTHLTILGMVLILSGCIPSVMMRDQERLGLQSWIAAAATTGHLAITFYGASSQALETEIVAVMDGHNWGPSVALALEKDSGKAGRVVVVLDPGFAVYKDRLCSHPTDGFEKDVQENTRVALALCYNDLAYGYVIATSWQGRLVVGEPNFNEFYRRAFRLLTDPHYEIQELQGSCNANVC